MDVCESRQGSTEVSAANSAGSSVRLSRPMFAVSESTRSTSDGGSPRVMSMSRVILGSPYNKTACPPMSM